MKFDVMKWRKIRGIDLYEQFFEKIIFRLFEILQ